MPFQSAYRAHPGRQCMDAILDASQQRLIDSVRSLLVALRAAMEGWEHRPEEAGRLREAIAGFDELFLLVVTGEYNSGKSGLINALLGGRFLEQGVTPTTSQVQVLEFGPEGPAEFVDGRWRRYLPADSLREMHIVDTPGTNAIMREHEALTKDFVPRADLVLFVTSADRPFTESERAFLEMISDWGKKIVLVVNKIDLLEVADERAEVIAFVKDNAARIVGGNPTVFAVSARDAMRAIESPETGAAGELEGWNALTQWMRETLSASERFRLKVESPLGVAERVARAAGDEIEGRSIVLREDLEVIGSIRASLDAYAVTVRSEFETRLHAIDGKVMTLRERGEAFLDDRLRLGNIRSLLDGDRLREDFEAEVIGDAPKDINAEIGRAIDWIIDRESTQWREVRSRLDDRTMIGLVASADRSGLDGAGSAATSVDEGFASRRRALLETIGRDADTVLESFDPRLESRRLERDVQETLTRTALMEVGAIGLGVLIPLLATAHLLDFTGILAGSVLAAVGFTLLPYRRRKAAAMLRDRVAALRDELRSALVESFECELTRAATGMGNAIAPYESFVEEEMTSIEAVRTALIAFHDGTSIIRDKLTTDS